MYMNPFTPDNPPKDTFILNSSCPKNQWFIHLSCFTELGTVGSLGLGFTSALYRNEKQACPSLGI